MTSRYLDMEISTSPHLGRGLSVPIIMRNVVYALLPIIGVAVYTFGLSVFFLVFTTLVTCLMAERFICLWTRKPSTIGDYSAAITGILLGLTLPPGFPLWMAALGSVIAMALGKALFGGLGFNPFNPALVGRAFLQAAFPTAITTWSDAFQADRFTTFINTTLTLPFMKAIPDTVSGATALAAMKFDHKLADTYDLFIGNISGSAGETCALVILLGGGYLALRKMLDWRIPVGIFLSVLLVSGLFWWMDPKNPPPLFMLFSGGLMLGAVFMATDMVTSPVTPVGAWIYSGLIGVLVVFIRLFGGLPEGVMYAILLGNAATPLINLMTQPKVYGSVKGGKKD
ncbi:MAG: electron transporter RnfD [Deltaproteobacteria bacterium RIFCSPLOWO2_12_FULL_50_11]|nr:MAG: electron transporter RnfD [Deltaproteobacteria bacterium GWA2_50_8]OGQ69017.1 MAG: electron transporter RnfD [Deltaproteobacteria bacterium RIFCSPLOWO2_12_FULL_50_11]